jgi:hypothetical protein
MHGLSHRFSRSINLLQPVVNAIQTVHCNRNVVVSIAVALPKWWHQMPTNKSPIYSYATIVLLQPHVLLPSLERRFALQRQHNHRLPKCQLR